MLVCDLIFLAAECIIGFVFVMLLSGSTFSGKTSAAVGGCIYFVVCFGASLLPYVLFRLISMLALFLLCISISDEHRHKLFAYSSTAVYCISASEIIVKNLMMTLMSEDYKIVFYGSLLNHIIILIIVSLAEAGTVYAAYRIFTREKLDTLREMWMHYSFIMSAFTLIAGILVSFYPLDGSNTERTPIILAVSVLFLIISLVVTDFFVQICIAHRREKQMYILRSDHMNMKEQLAVQFRTSKRLQKIRHDIKNHLTGAAALIENGEYDKAAELLNEINDSADRLQPVLNQTSGNSLIDSIIAYKSAVCESKNISFEYTLEQLPDTRIDLADISSVLANLLDNAVEAAELSERRIVNVKIFAYKDYLTIIVKNTFSGIIKQEKGKLGTLIHDSDPHGLGTEIISEICERNNGIYKYRILGKMFTASAMMRI